MRFTINLATRTYIDHRLVNLVIIASILLLTLAFGLEDSQLLLESG